MADSPPRHDVQGPPPGGEPEGAHIVEDTGPQVTLVPESGGQGAPAAAPWGASPPWWSSAGSGTPPSGVVPVADGQPGPDGPAVSDLAPGQAGIASALNGVTEVATVPPVGGDGARALEPPRQPGPPGQHGQPAQRALPAPSGPPPPGQALHYAPPSGQAPPMRNSGPQSLPVPVQHRRPDVLVSGPRPDISVPALPAWDPNGQPRTAAPGSGTARKPGSRLLLAVVAGAALTVVLVAVLFVVRPGGGEGGRDGGGKDAPPAPTRQIAAAPSAGGLRKGTAEPAAGAAYPFVAAAVQAGGVPVAHGAVAIYTDAPVPGPQNVLAGPPAESQNVLFMGGTGQVGDPAAFLKKTRPSTFITAEGIDPGPGGGQAVCGTFAVLADVHLYCAWATRDSYGIVASDTPAESPDTTALAGLMNRMRPELERPK